MTNPITIHRIDDDELARRPAVLVREDGTHSILPDCSVREAIAVVRSARALGELIGGDIDPDDIVSIGYYDE